MFAPISRRLLSNGIGKALYLEFHLHHSTTPAPAAASANKSEQKNCFLAEYLVNTLGFSKEEAISTAKKVTPRLKPITKDPDLVVNFFENSGLNKTQIKSVICSHPNMLLCNMEKTLKPKFEFLQQLGLSGPDLGKFLMRNKSLLEAGLDSHVKPRIEFLKNLLGDDEKVALVLRRCPSLLTYNALKILEKNMLSLGKIGFSDKYILKFIIKYPKMFLVDKDGWFEDIGQRVENDFGISPKSFSFYHGVQVLGSYRQTTLDAKYSVLRSYGWSDVNIGTLVKIYPLILAASEDKLRRTLDFLMNEVGYSPEYLASRMKFFSVSLEKRVIPRYEVLKLLNEKNLIKRKISFHSVVGMPESKFLMRFLLPYKEEAPDVYRSYAERVQS